MKRTFLAATAAVSVLVLPPAAQAAHEPAALGSAIRGSLIVSSQIVGAPRLVVFSGGWLNDAVPCNQARRLVLRASIDFRSRTQTRTVFRRREGIRLNCAEGGPNLERTVRAARVNLACANGRWRPGLYTFVARTRHVATGVVSVVTLDWRQTRRC